MPKRKKWLWRRVVLTLLFSLLILAGLAYAFRFKLAAWYLDGNLKARSIVIAEMAKRAEPAIEREVHMTIPQTIFSFVTGRRGEDARERDALQDVRSYSEMSFRNGWLRSRDVHGQAALGGFDLAGSDLALVWERGRARDVLLGFRVDLLKRQASAMRVNGKCAFFAEMKRYVKKRAKEN